MIFIFAASGLIDNLTGKKWFGDALFQAKHEYVCGNN